MMRLTAKALFIEAAALVIADCIAGYDSGKLVIATQGKRRARSLAKPSRVDSTAASTEGDSDGRPHPHSTRPSRRILSGRCSHRYRGR
jgi:hypothetical protein